MRINKILITGVKQTAVLLGCALFSLLLFAAPVFAAPATQGTTVQMLGGLADAQHGGTTYIYQDANKTIPLKQGYVIQIIDSIDNIDQAPKTDGSVWNANDEQVLATITVGANTLADGTFYNYFTAANHYEGHYIYVRAWDAATIGAATHYGDSQLKLVDHGTPFAQPLTWTVPSFSTALNKPAIPPVPVASAATLVTNNTFSANWAASAGAIGYYLDVATDAGFNSILANYNNKSVGNVITAPVSGLTANTAYYYRVRATNANGTSASSNVINLTTKLSAPTNLTTSAITKTGATANWNAVAGATSYTVSYGTNVAADNLGTLPTASNSVALPNLSAGTTYYWKALATNAGGSSAYSAPVSFTTVVNAPAAPTNLSATPAQTSATVSWTAPAGPVSSYTISYGTDVNATNGGTISPATNPDDIPNLAPGTTYYVKVSATNAGGTGPYSNTATFTTIFAQAPNVTLTNPTGGNTLKGGQAYNITWTNNGGVPNHYNLAYSTDGGATYPNVISDVATSPYNWTVPSINSAQVRVRVEAHDVNHAALSTSTSGSNFTIDSTAPTISSFNPANNANGVGLEQEVVITFSEAVDPVSFKFTLSPNPGGLGAGWNPGNKVVTISHTAFQGSTPYTVTVTAVSDVAGNAMVANNNATTFTTVAPNAPQIDSTSWEQNKDTGYTYGTLNLNGSKFGANQGGSSVELRFQGGQYFTLPNANVYYWNDGKIQIGIPQNVTANYAVAGNTDVRLTVNGQTASTTFVLKPKVYSVTPNSGPVGTKVVIEGTGFNPVAASNSVGFSGTPAAGTKVTQGTNVDTLEVTVPQGATTGQLLVTVNGQSSNTNFDWGNKDQIVFTVIVPGQPVISTASLPDGTVNAAYNKSLTASNGTAPYTWTITAGTLPTGLSLNTAGVISGTPTVIGGPTTVTFKVTDAAAQTATKQLSITIIDVIPGGPSVSTVLPSPATIGQTITISGSGLGDNMGSSLITIGGKTAKPTAWTATSITVAVPTGVASGTAVVAVTVNGVTANSSVTVDTSKIMVDDFEGGAVGTFAAPAADSGYYVFDKYDAQYNANIKSSSYPSMEANKANPKAGLYSAELRYSYGLRSTDPQYASANNDWGGGWGGKLANTLNLSTATKFGFQVRWDGSANDLNLAFKDSDGTVYTAAVSNGRLTPANASYTEIIVNPADFAAEPTSKGANPAMDWSNIVEYQFTYKSKNTAANKHYIDSVIAYLTGGSPDPNPVTGEAPVIGAITPSAAPAGTMVTVTGSRFGSPQGSSTLTFTNRATGVSYPADIVNWNDGTIQAIVPTKALVGDYEIKVKRESIAQGVVTAFESAPAAFQVTASAAEVATVYPNPFNAGKESVNISISNSANATNIGYYLYDMTARLVWKQIIATKQTTWDGRDIYSATVGDGAYILRVVNEDNKTLLAKGKILVVKH